MHEDYEKHTKITNGDEILYEWQGNCFDSTNEYSQEDISMDAQWEEYYEEGPLCIQKQWILWGGMQPLYKNKGILDLWRMISMKLFMIFICFS